MNNFFGSAAGILMIALIAILLYRFLLEMGVPVKETTKKKIIKYGIAGVGLIFVQVLIAGLIYNFYKGRTNIFELNTIWSVASVNNYVGTPSIYIYLRDIFAKLLFDKTNDCGMYISLVCGIVTMIASGIFLTERYGEEKGTKLHILMMCFPGNFITFLPSPYAMFITFYMLYFVAANRKKVVLSGVFALIAALSHIVGVTVIILWIIEMAAKLISDKYSEYIRLGVLAVTQIFVVVISCINNWEYTVEMWYLAVFPVVCCFGKVNALFEENKTFVYKYTAAVLTIVSGFYIMLNIAG